MDIAAAASPQQLHKQVAHRRWTSCCYMRSKAQEDLNPAHADNFA
jgi:hypothetical protein